MMGELGLGLPSFSVGTPPEQLRERINLYRAGIARCKKPLGAFINDRAAAFTMVNCAPTREESHAASRESFQWYAKRSAELVASVTQWLEELKARADGTYAYLDQARVAVASRLHELASLSALLGLNAAIAGDPGEVLERCKAYEATGADLPLCLVNPYKIPHEKVIQTIELMGKHVLPKIRTARRAAQSESSLLTPLGFASLRASLAASRPGRWRFVSEVDAVGTPPRNTFSRRE